MCLLITVCSWAQTKLIAYKSHSGNAKNFRTAFENNLFDMAYSNFGLSPEIEKPKIKKISSIDSVIYVSDSVVTLVRSWYCTGSAYKDSKPCATERNNFEYTPVLNKKHKLDSIKSRLKNELQLDELSLKKAQYVGFKSEPTATFQKSSKEKTKKNSLPFIPISEQQKPPFPTVLLVILAGVVAVLGCVVYRLSLRLQVK